MPKLDRKQMTYNVMMLSTALCLLQGCIPTAMVSTTAGIAMAGSDPRSFKGVMSDRQIKTQIHKNWLSSSIDLSIALDVMVWEGRVLLTGHVKRPEIRARAVHLAWKAPGVQEVLDHITVAGHSTPISYASDNLISTKIGTKLLFEKNVYSNNYGVRVQNNIVYLMGVALSQDELSHVTRIAQDTSSVEKIISYVRIMSPEEVTHFLKDKKTQPAKAAQPTSQGPSGQESEQDADDLIVEQN